MPALAWAWLITLAVAYVGVLLITSKWSEPRDRGDDQ